MEWINSYLCGSAAIVSAGNILGSVVLSCWLKPEKFLLTNKDSMMVLTLGVGCYLHTCL